MKGLAICSVLFLLVSFSMTCQKKMVEVSVSPEVEYFSGDTITYRKLPRNDVPPPPVEPWWTIDTENLDSCQQRIWGYLKKMYPMEDNNYWDYRLYSIMDEPEEVFANRALVSRNIHFFRDTIRWDLLPCESVDTNFYLQALGPPTCRSYNPYKKKVNYFYYFRLKYRSGPCAHIFDEGSEYEQHCWPLHFDYCAGMGASFSEETGKLIFASFSGSGN